MSVNEELCQVIAAQSKGLACDDRAFEKLEAALCEATRLLDMVASYDIPASMLADIIKWLDNHGVKT